jgi:hypothetical protein
VSISRHLCRGFKYEVGIFHSDNELALGEKLDTWMKEKRYTIEYTAHIPQAKMEPPNDQED